MFYEFGGLFLGDLNVILLKYGSVYTFVKGETGFFANRKSLDSLQSIILYGD